MTVGRSFAVGFALIALGTVLAVGVLEIAARLLLPTRDAVIVDDRELGWFHPRDQWVTLEGSGFATRTYFNRDGLRNSEPPGTGDRTIVVLGDSMVEGIHVSDRDVVSRRLQGLLRARGHAVSVLNAGVSGYGTVQEYLLAGRILPNLRPAAVVLVVTTENDLTDNVDPYGGRRPMVVVAADGSWRVIRPTAGWFARALRSGLQRLRLAQVAREHLVRVRVLQPLLARLGLAHVGGTGLSPDSERGFQILRVLVAETSNLARRAGSRCFLLVAAPRERDVEPGGEWSVAEVQPVYRRINALCGAMGIACLDLYPVFRAWQAAGRPALYAASFGGHWTVDGHALVAEAVAARLQATCFSQW